MITPVVQRWRDGRDSYRPAGETIAPARYEVAAIPDDTTAKAFVLGHHYSGSYPAARHRFGLYRAGQLVGVAVFSHPMAEKVLDVLPGERGAKCELGRFVLLDAEPANAETWFLGRAFDLLRRAGIEGVVSFSDPVPRTSLAGTRVFPGHVGTIYQAFNGVYLGRGTPRTLKILPAGTVICARTISKIRARESRWESAAALLERAGAAPLGPDQDSRAWLALWLPRLTRNLRHGGNHRYVWALDKQLRRHLPAGQAYPKLNPTPRLAA